MRKTLLVGALASLTLTCLAPAAFAKNELSGVATVGIDVPAATKAAVARLYPGAKGVKWEKEDGNYEAGLTHNGKELSLVIDAKGNVLETETTIAVSALPAPVQAYVTKHHAGKKIKEAAEIVDAKGKKTYEAQVGGKDLIFDEKGTPIK
ncbi:PepSY-like domain-containing protein [uncultured Fibrella sp.]|uniref:PepSY-like domain-containing protein n=1 Tax=uncultured Fibrella sp. TaxID=1284596 RepID=UPI0035CA5C20